MLTAIARATALLGVLALAGCAAPVEGGESPSASEPVPTPLVRADCETLLGEAELAAGFTAGITSVPVAWYSSGDYFEFAEIGLEQAGALRCEWSDGGSPEAYIRLSVLPDAAASWAALSSELAVYQPRANEFGDTTYSSCSATNGYSSCRIDALVGDRWISAILAGLSSVDAAPAVMTAIIDGVTAADPAESDWPVADSAPIACESLLPLDQLRAELGVEVEPWDNPLPTMAVSHAGFLAAGGTQCAWRNAFSSASAMTVSAAVLPGGAWAWTQHWLREPHETVTREFIDGLGSDAVTGCSDAGPCWVAVLDGDDWIAITVNDEASPDEREAAIALARLAINEKDTP